MNNASNGEDELLDVLNENGISTGIVKPRNKIHSDGDWHQAVHTWIVCKSRRTVLIRVGVWTFWEWMSEWICEVHVLDKGGITSVSFRPYFYFCVILLDGADLGVDTGKIMKLSLFLPSKKHSQIPKCPPCRRRCRKRPTFLPQMGNFHPPKCQNSLLHPDGVPKNQCMIMAACFVQKVSAKVATKGIHQEAFPRAFWHLIRWSCEGVSVRHNWLVATLWNNQETQCTAEFGTHGLWAHFPCYCDIRGIFFFHIAHESEWQAWNQKELNIVQNFCILHSNQNLKIAITSLIVFFANKFLKLPNKDRNYSPWA